MLIKAKNNLTDIAIKTYLSNGEVSGANSLRVKNIAGFTASWGIQVGETGNEQSEVLILSASTPSGTALSVTGTALYDHPADVPVYATKYNQLVFKRSTSGTLGTATAMTNGTISITPDNVFTAFDDTSGAVTYAYKVAFRNSVSGDVSSDSDWITPAGYSFYSLAKITDRIRGRLYDSAFVKNDEIIHDWVNEWKERLDNAAVDVNKDYSLGTTSVAFAGTAELGTITATDFKDLRRVWFTNDGQSFFQATKMTVNNYIPNQTFNATHPYFYMQGDNVIGRKPNDASGTANIVYYKFNTPLVNDTDELPVVQRNYSKSYVDYGNAKALYMDGKYVQGKRLEDMALAELDKYRAEISARLKTGTTYIRLEEPITGEDGEFF